MTFKSYLLILVACLLQNSEICRCMHIQNEASYDDYDYDPQDQTALVETIATKLDSAFKHHFRTVTDSPKDPIEINQIHFQMENHKSSVTLTKLKMSLQESPTYEKWDSNPEQSRLESVANYPKLILQGRYRIDRSKYFDDFDTAIEGYFRYITNITSTCLGFLGPANKLTVVEVDCNYQIAPLKVQFKKQKTNINLDSLLTQDNFAWIFENKLWHDLTWDLDQSIRSDMNRELNKKPSRLVTEEDEERQRNETRQANLFIDQVLLHARRVINEQYGDRIRLPDIDDSFEQSLVIVPVHGRVVCHQGRLEGSTSVSRIGDCKLASNVGGVEGNIHYYGKLGFKQLRIIYENYKVSVLGLGPSGSLTAKLYPVEIMVHLHADYNEGVVSLDKFKVTHVGDLLIDLTGSMVGLDWLMSVIGSFIVNMVRDNVINDLEQRYAEYIREILSKYSLTDILMENYPDLAA